MISFITEFPTESVWSSNGLRSEGLFYLPTFAIENMVIQVNDIKNGSIK